MTKFPVLVCTPTEVVFEGECELVSFKTLEGWMGVLARRAPFVGLLDIEEVKLVLGEGTPIFFLVDGGFIEADGERVTIVTSRVENPEEIDRHLAEQALKEAEKAVQSAQSEVEKARAMAEFRKASARVKSLERRKSSHL
ncbi:MAG: ATP synthase F1 subunit epsilon [Thermotogae bacterium]|nr:ATP synthase F1 subunit epsilon [Thermotogota bacterium]RKX42808.1 MAG: ATP synthase F1 subunit epsilon [Thermotogota bacterium]